MQNKTPSYFRRLSLFAAFAAADVGDFLKGRAGLILRDVRKQDGSGVVKRWVNPNEEDTGQLSLFGKPSPPSPQMSLFDVNDSYQASAQPHLINLPGGVPPSAPAPRQTKPRNGNSPASGSQPARPRLSLFQEDSGSVEPAESQPGEPVAPAGDVGNENRGVQRQDGSRSNRPHRESRNGENRSGTDGGRNDGLPDESVKEETPSESVSKDTTSSDTASSDTASVSDDNVPDTDNSAPSPTSPDPVAPFDPTPAFVARGLKTQEDANSTDFILTDEHEIGSGGLKQKARDNFAAIDLLTQLDKEERSASEADKGVLARYVGWGAFGQAFHPELKNALQKEAREWFYDKNYTERNALIDEHGSSEEAMHDYEGRLSWGDVREHMPANMQSDTWGNHFELRRQLEKRLTPEEMEESWQASRTAFYTSPDIVKAMWEAVDGFGFKGGRVLEPSCGTGNFFGFQPESTRGASNRFGVELDSVTGRIARHLYPETHVQIKGFEKTNFADDTFDLVIGNPPFGATKVFDAEFERTGRKRFGENLHGYFFAKSLAKTKPGGVIAFVISRQFMDSKSGQGLREDIAQGAHFLGAVRLPDDAFTKNAGTGVTTDIIFLQKKDPAFEALHPRDAQGHFIEKWHEAVPFRADGHARNGYADGRDVLVNEYFAEHPENMLGKISLESGMYREDDFGLRREGYDISQLGSKLRERFAEILPKDIFQEPSGGDSYGPVADEADKALAEAPGHVKVGAYHIGEDGEVFRNLGGHLHPVEFRATQADPGGALAKERVVGLVNLRDTALELNAAEVRDDLKVGDDSANLAYLREKLNGIYDEFTEKFGLIHDATNKNKRAYSGQVGQVFAEDEKGANVRAKLGDPDAGLVFALEEKVVDAEGRWDGQSWQKAPIFARRIISPSKRPDTAATVEDALSICLNECNGLNFERLSDLLKREPEDICDELARKSLVFLDPTETENATTGGWQTRDQYLTGNVRDKLAQAREAAEHDQRFIPNVRALEDAQPARVPPGDIDARLGAAWVPVDLYEQFIEHLVGEAPMWNARDGKKLVSYLPTEAKWLVDTSAAGDHRRHDISNTQKWGTKNKTGLELLMATMNGIEVKITKQEKRGDDLVDVVDRDATNACREKQRLLREEFAAWMMADPERAEKWATIYNDIFNDTVLRMYDGSHLTFPGMSAHWQEKMRPAQKNFVWRALQEGGGLADHTVGTGKTSSAIALAMESRRLGTAKKPMVVVPCHLVAQWDADIRDQYPGAKILTVWAKDWSPEKRMEMTSRIATGDWDFVLISHTAFGQIPTGEEPVNRFYQDQISELMEAMSEAKSDRSGGNGKTRADSAKAIQNRIQNLREKLKSKIAQIQANQDKSLNWEQLGVDLVIADEIHYFKNLAFQTRHQRLPGVGGTESGRAMDMFLKTQHVQLKNKGRGFVGLSGTPISNSLCEMYTMQRFFNFKELKRRGLKRFDNWLQTFGNIETSQESAPEGGYRERTRVASFSNVPEMARMYREVADVQTADMLKLPVPKVKGGGPQNVVAPGSDALARFMLTIRERAEILTGQRGGDKIPPPTVDNFLKLTSDARKASLDVRLVDGFENEPDDPHSKVNMCVASVIDAHRRSTEYKGTQMVFLDMSTPKGANEGAPAAPFVLAAQSGAYEASLAEGDGEKVARAKAKVAGSQAKKEHEAIERARKEEVKTGAKAAQIDAEQAVREYGGSAKEAKEAGVQAKTDYISTWEAEHDDANRMEGGDDEEIETAQEQQKRYQAYSDIKAKLIKGGVPEHEVVFAHDYDTDARKSELREKMNSGEIRVLLGSTAKMGAGANFQKRLFALHHLDCPWKPADLEQREGRIVRQGNDHYKKNIPVEINRYATKGSFDEFMWQQIEKKAKFIAQTRSGNLSGRTVDDIDPMQLSAAQMKAMSSDSPEAARLVELDTEQKRLESLKRSHANQIDAARVTMRELPVKAATHEALAMKADAAHARLTQNPAGIAGGDFNMTVGNRSFDKREDAGKALLMSHAQAVRSSGAGGAHIANWGPFSLHAVPDIDPTNGNRRFRMDIKDGNSLVASHVSEPKAEGEARSPIGTLASVATHLRNLKQQSNWHRDEAARARQNAEVARGEAEATWPHAGRYEQVKGEIKGLHDAQKKRLADAQKAAAIARGEVPIEE